MLSDILYKSDILDGLFTQKDFEFLKDTNNRQEEVEFKIKIADLKRNKIIENIKSIDINSDEIKNADSNALKQYVDDAENAFKGINIMIRNLNSIIDDFNNIEKEVLELIVKKDANNSIDTNVIMQGLYTKISEFKQKQTSLELQNKKYEELVDKFLGITEEDNNVELRKKVSKKVKTDIEDNLQLVISEKKKRVYLPYTGQEIQEYLENYPGEYKSAKDVIEQEFIADISVYNKHPVLARFREAYSLSRNKEMKSTIDSLRYAMDYMFRSDINPTIIAAVKSQKQFDTYIKCLEENKIESFPYFKIIFEINPL